MISKSITPQELFGKHARETKFVERVRKEGHEFYFWKSKVGYEVQVCEAGYMPTSYYVPSFRELRRNMRNHERRFTQINKAPWLSRVFRRLSGA